MSRPPLTLILIIHALLLDPGRIEREQRVRKEEVDD